MNKILMITSRAVVDSNGQQNGVGAATLIYRRATEMYNIFNARTYILPLNAKSNSKETRYPGCEMLNSSNQSNREIITSFIINKKPEMVVLSGEKSYFYAELVKKIITNNDLKTEIVVDLHGALEEKIEYTKGLIKAKNFLVLKIKHIMFKSIMKYTDAFFIVSDELYEHYQKLVPTKYGIKKSYKIRCGVNDLLSVQTKLSWREEIRRKFLIDQDTVVFVYSGFRAEWQCINEIVDNFRTVDSLQKKVFFMLLTKSDEAFSKLLKDSFPNKNYYVGLIPHNEIHKYLSACDVGMLIRHENYTNKVAFPNKFSDYINAGLFVTLSPSLREPNRLLKNYDIPHLELSPDDLFNSNDLTLIKERQMDLEAYYKKTDLLCQEELLYSSQIKKLGEQLSMVFNNADCKIKRDK